MITIYQRPSQQTNDTSQPSYLPSDDYYESMLEYKSKRKSLEFQGLFNFSTIIAHS